GADAGAGAGAGAGADAGAGAGAGAGADGTGSDFPERAKLTYSCASALSPKAFTAACTASIAGIALNPSLRSASLANITFGIVVISNFSPAGTTKSGNFLKYPDFSNESVHFCFSFILVLVK